MKTWQESSIKRRDERNTKSSDEHKKVSGKKDTKRWCNGKVDREHKLQGFVKQVWNDRIKWYVLACSECGKELEHYYPIFSYKGKPKPEWVIELERNK